MLVKNKRFFIPNGRAQNFSDGAKVQGRAVQGRKRQNSEENGEENGEEDHLRAFSFFLCALQLFRPLPKLRRKSCRETVIVSYPTQPKCLLYLFFNPRVIFLTRDLISSHTHLLVSIPSDFRHTEMLFLLSLQNFFPEYLKTFTNRCKRPCVVHCLGSSVFSW